MGARWILAIDLGNGGPKVGVISLEGEVRHTAMRPVHVNIGLDGAATQDAGEWWTGLREAAREAIEGAGADRDELHAVAITGQWASSVPVGRRRPARRRSPAVVRHPRPRPRARGHRRTGQHLGVCAAEGAAVPAPHRGSTNAERRRPHRPLAAAAGAAARGVRKDRGHPRAGRLSSACGSQAGPPRRRLR